MSQNTAPERDEYINYLEPVLVKMEPFYEGKPWTAPRNHMIVVAALVAAVSVVAWFFPLYDMQWIWVIVGIALGIGLFVTGYFTAVVWTENRMNQDHNFLSLKRRYSPTKRLRFGIIAFVILLSVSAVTLSSLPHVFGGIVMVSGALAIYSFIQRTPSEFKAFMEGEVDQRDMEEAIAAEPDAQVPDDQVIKEAEAYAELINSLPEEQRAILLNPRVNGVISVETQDDKKEKKGFIRRMIG